MKTTRMACGSRFIIGFAGLALLIAAAAPATDGLPPEAFVGNCGVERAQPGCSDTQCAQCVCDPSFGDAPFCCTQAWDVRCIIIAEDTCASACLAANRVPAPAISHNRLPLAALILLGIGLLALKRRA